VDIAPGGEEGVGTISQEVMMIRVLQTKDALFVYTNELKKARLDMPIMVTIRATTARHALVSACYIMANSRHEYSCMLT
jgi:hypothetical protein